MDTKKYFSLYKYKMKYVLSQHSAFTLVEILCVVAIIGILAAIFVPSYMNAITRAKVASTYERIHTIHLAITNYMVDHKMYPPAGHVFNIWFPYTYANLTTPVSYLSSIEVCIDAFYIHEAEIPTGNSIYYFRYDASLSYITERDKIINIQSSNPERYDQVYGRSYDKGMRYL